MVFYFNKELTKLFKITSHILLRIFQKQIIECLILLMLFFISLSLSFSFSSLKSLEN